MGIRYRIARRLLGPEQFDELALVASLLPARGGVMFDVGAHIGTSAEPFARRGWLVHAFEPDASNRAVLQERLGGRIEIDPRAVTDRSGEHLEFFTSALSTGISSLSAFHSSHTASQIVETVTLADAIRERRTSRIDLLKIDTEGHDLFVLRGMDWAVRPAVVVCEFEDRKTALLGYNTGDLANLLQSEGYAVLVSEWCPITAYGREHQWRRLVPFEAGPSEDAWGNLIAVAPGKTQGALAAGRRLERRLRAWSRLRSIRGR